jgi:hypothetical protein
MRMENFEGRDGGMGKAKDIGNGPSIAAAYRWLNKPPFVER